MAESKRRKRYLSRAPRIETSLALAIHRPLPTDHPQQAPVVDLTFRVPTNSPAEVTIPLTQQDLRVAVEVAFWTLGIVGFVSFIEDLTRRR
jgi:hypothetical protein